jgi:hypothetical protein
MAKKAIVKATREKSDVASKASAGKAAGSMRAAAVATIDARRGKDRRVGNQRQKDVPVAVERRQIERRAKVNRRRQIDPTTCERDYSPEEIEFMGALDAYKRRSGRMFPTCSEVLEVIKGLGYEKRPATPPAVDIPDLVVAPAAV